MCGYGDSNNICIYLGYYGSYIGVNDKYYNPHNDKEVKKNKCVLMMFRKKIKIIILFLFIYFLFEK